MLALLDEVVLEVLSDFWVVHLREMEEDGVVLHSQRGSESLVLDDLRVVDVHLGVLLLCRTLRESSLGPLDLLLVLSALSSLAPWLLNPVPFLLIPAATSLGVRWAALAGFLT